MKTEPMAELPAELKQNLTRYQAPPGLKRRIRYMLDQQSPATAPATAPWASWRRWAPTGAGFACGALLGVALMIHQGALRDEDQVEQQVVAGHVRSLMVAHLTDVASTDQHTVKPWFTGKLDYAQPVFDLAAEGFPLVGGRLDYLQERPVAALVYRRKGHTINVFVLPSRLAQNSSASLETKQGYQLANWTRANMHFWAVSDLGRDELARFAAALQAAQ